jgi:hypothetical protein
VCCMTVSLLPNHERRCACADFGVQSVVRGCERLECLLLGGCAQLSNISTQLIASHLRRSLRRLDLSGLKNLLDVDIADLRRCRQLTSLSVVACVRLTDASLEHLATLATAQNKVLGAHPLPRDDAMAPSAPSGLSQRPSETRVFDS